MERTSIRLWILAGLLFAAVAAVAVYKVWPLLNPEVVAIAPLDPDCDLRAGPCRSSLPEGGEISFSIKPDTIPLIKPLRLEVRVKGLKVASAEVDFVGVDMNMGFNRPSLSMQDEDVFVGEGMLPVCVRNAMEWEAKVLLKTDAGLVAAPFRFITVKEGADLPGGSR